MPPPASNAATGPEGLAQRGLLASRTSTVLLAVLLGAAVAAFWLAHGGADAVRSGRVLWATLFAMLALAALVQTANVYLAAAIACAMGFAGETRKTGTMSIIQLSVDEAQRGTAWHRNLRQRLC